MKIEKISIKLVGIKPLIFNVFNSTEDVVPAIKKVPLVDGKLAIRGDRILSFLIANNPKHPTGCIKLFTDSKKYKSILPKCKAYVGIQSVIPVLINDKEVQFKSFDKTPEVKVRKDQVCGGTLPMIVERPYVENWSLEFNINLIENAEISAERLNDWFQRGGIEVGLGASRPVYGQFIVDKFEIQK
jgi:hypothetical protein